MDNLHSIHKKDRRLGLDFFLQFVCHRIPERTFKIKGHYFPVCSRCTGIYLGGGFCLVINNFFNIQETLNLFILSIIMILPTLIDGLSQFFGLRKSNNPLRFSTGLIGGVGLVIIIGCLKLYLEGV